MSSLSSKHTQLRLILPAALTQLYFNVLDVSSSPMMRHIDYLCSFEDDPQKIAKINPDILIRFRPPPVLHSVHDLPKIEAERLIVAAPDYIEHENISRPADLERLTYAALGEIEETQFYVTTPAGKTMVISPSKRFGSKDPFAAHEAAKQGIAFAVLPKFMIAEDLRNGILRPLCSHWPPEAHHVQIMINPRCASTPQAKHMAAMIHEKLLKLPGLCLAR